VAAVIATLVYVVRGGLRERRWTFDASLLCGAVLMTWQDPGINYLVSQFSYSSVLINFGSWTSDIPGWVSPRANLLPETLLTLLAYIFLAGIVIGTSGLLRKFVMPRFPNISNAKFIALVCVLMILLDFLIEVGLAHGHVLSYHSVIESWTLWPGTDHQFPIYESLVWGVTGWAPFVVLRWFRDDKGRSFVERGLDQMRISNKFKNVLTRDVRFRSAALQQMPTPSPVLVGGTCPTKPGPCSHSPGGCMRAAALSKTRSAFGGAIGINRKACFYWLSDH